MSPPRYDIISLGLGPAGAACLERLAQAGWRVAALLPDEQRHTLYPNPDGLPVSGYWPRRSPPMKGSWLCPVPSQPRGVKRLQLERVLKLEPDEQGWRVRVEDSRGRNHTLPTRLWLESRSGGPQSRLSALDRSGRTTWELEAISAGDGSSTRQLEEIWSEALAQGWLAAFPTGPGRAALCWNGLLHSPPPTFAELQELSFVVGELLDDWKPVGNPRTSAGLGLSAPLHGARWFTCDEAASARPLFSGLDPEDEREAGELLAEALLAAPYDQSRLLALYAQKVRGQLSFDRRRQRRYEEAADIEGSDYWQRWPRPQKGYRILLDPWLRFDCGACGKCCNIRWQVKVEAELKPALRKLYLSLPLQPDEEPFVEKDDGQTVFAHSKNGCVFLSDDSLCHIHDRLGPEMKPQACRNFPFSFVQAPEGIRAAVSFFCCAVQRQAGRPLEAHREELQSQAREFELRHQPPDLEVVPGLALSLEAYNTLKHSLEVSEDMQTTLLRTAFGLARWVHLGGPPPAQFGPAESTAAVAQELALNQLLVLGSDSKPERAIQQAAHRQGQAVTLANFKFRGHLDELQSEPVADFVAAETEFYRKALVRNDGLLQRGEILDNLLLLASLKPLLSWLTVVQSRMRQAEALEVVDFRRALDLVESLLVTHNRATEVVSAATTALLALAIEKG